MTSLPAIITNITSLLEIDTLPTYTLALQAYTNSERF